MAKDDETGTDRPSRAVRAAIFGSIDLEKYLKRQWTGGFEPDIKELAKPFLKGFAKEFCSGCGSHNEVTEEHISRIMKMINRDPNSVDWKKFYLELNACDFCIESVPDNLMVSIAAGKLPETKPD